MRRPLLSAVLATAMLLALAIPGLSMNTTQTGIDDLPQDLAVIQTYNHYTDAFPAEANVNEVVVKAGNVRSGEVAASIDRLVAERRPVEDLHRSGGGHLQQGRNRRPDRASE